MEAIKVAFPNMVSLSSIFPLLIFRKAVESGRRVEDYAIQSVQR